MKKIVKPFIILLITVIALFSFQLDTYAAKGNLVATKTHKAMNLTNLCKEITKYLKKWDFTDAFSTGATGTFERHNTSSYGDLEDAKYETTAIILIEHNDGWFNKYKATIQIYEVKTSLSNPNKENQTAEENWAINQINELEKEKEQIEKMDENAVVNGKTKEELIAENEQKTQVQKEALEKIYKEKTGVLATSNATSSHTLDEIIKEAQEFISLGKQAGSKIPTGELKEASSTLYNILLSIGIFAAVGVGMYLGVKFMMSSAEDRAKVKESLIPYIAGCIVIFGAFIIWKLTVNLLSGIDKVSDIPYQTEYVVVAQVQVEGESHEQNT